MRIVYPWYFFPFGDIETGENSIQVNSTDSIHFFKQEIKEKPGIIFYVKELAFFKKTVDPFLLKFFFPKRNRVGACIPYQSNHILVFCQRSAYAVHPLIICNIIRYRKENRFQRIMFNV